MYVHNGVGTYIIIALDLKIKNSSDHAYLINLICVLTFCILLRTARSNMLGIGCSICVYVLCFWFLQLLNSHSCASGYTLYGFHLLIN